MKILHYQNIKKLTLYNLYDILFHKKSICIILSTKIIIIEKYARKKLIYIIFKGSIEI